MTPTVRVRLLSGLLWVLVAAGPLIGGAALLRPTGTPAPVAPGPPVGVTGLAELAVLAHLRSQPGEAPAVLMPAHPALRPVGNLLDDLTTAERAIAGRVPPPVHAAAAVTSSPAGPGRWGVVVAVLREQTVETWQVTVAASDRGPVIETVPAPVALPTGVVPTPAVTALRPPDPDDPLTDAVQRFLSALLTDEGELDRYLAPGAVVQRPALVASEALLRRLATGPIGTSQLAVLAEARVRRADGWTRLVQYPLLMQRTDGQWEVLRILPALPVQDAPVPDRP